MNILDYTWENYVNGQCDILDAHCHLKRTSDFKLICCGLIPSGFEFDNCSLSDNVFIGLGYHPWGIKVSDLSSELEIFKNNIDKTNFIGEVGLDFSEKHISNKNEQLEVFENIARYVSDKKDKVISIHSVKAASDVMDIVEKYKLLDKHILIMHWFSGTSKELDRALSSGYYFSVGPKMMDTNKGHEYIRQLPESRMFIETDLPWDGVEVNAEEHLNLLNDFVMQLRELISY